MAPLLGGEWDEVHVPSVTNRLRIAAGVQPVDAARVITLPGCLAGERPGAVVAKDAPVKLVGAAGGEIHVTAVMGGSEIAPGGKAGGPSGVVSRPVGQVRKRVITGVDGFRCRGRRLGRFADGCFLFRLLEPPPPPVAAEPVAPPLPPGILGYRRRYAPHH